MKIGIFGLGARVGYLAKLAVQSVPGARLVGYVDPSPFGLPLLAEAGIDAGRAFASPQELLAAEKLDLLMVGSPNHMHLEHIRIGLEAGLKVFTEKPVVTSEDETWQLLELLRQSGGADSVMIGLVLRYAPLYRDLVASYRQGALGTITSIEASEHIAPYHGAFFMRDWRRHTRYSGGFILEKCCHDIDLYQGLVGSRPVRVASFGGRKTFVPENMPNKAGINDLEVYFRKPGGWESTDRVWDSDADIIDYQTALVEYAGGENLCFHTNLNVPDEYRHFTVIGTHGMAEGDFVRNYYRVHDARTGERLVDKGYRADAGHVHYGADEQMIADIFAHVTTGVPLPVSILDGLEAGLTAIKIDEARGSRQVIEMGETWRQFDSFGLRG
ncbi:MAG: Gfo/Idh/MocA family oxidoreductase [Devosia sp.]|uniref:Gfo/Idh/MocA family protein n=1 Tax=Devosia sp. TaxID=1871048 RepID=UPI001AD271E3|nr:Gfo/Idh/MocA family oxidoreductase [Devosia sp.]MBN9317473.1 Gfo/Idh/MocA family oxidoreductase [Devosia sp.]